MTMHSRPSTKGLVETMFRNVNMVFTPTGMKPGNSSRPTKLVLDLGEYRARSDFLNFLRCELRKVAGDIRTQFPLSRDATKVKAATKRRGNGHGF